MSRGSGLSTWWRTVGALAAGVVALAVVAVAAPVSAETVEVDIGDVVVQGEAGSTQQIGSATVDAELVGRSCDLVATVTNQSSVHPQNKLVVASGGSTIEIPGIEAQAGGVTVQPGTLTLGETITVSVVLGPSKISSLGSSLTVTCEPLPPAPPPPPVKGEPPYTG